MKEMRLAKWLPQTDSELLRLVVIGLATGCVWLAVIYFQGAIDGQLFLGLLTFVLWLPLAVGLWLLKQWARFLALTILWLMVFAVPFGQVSAMAVVDGDLPPLPIWEQLIYRVAPLVIPATFFIEVLHAYGSEFQWPRGSEAAAANSASARPTPPRSWLLWCLGVIAVPALLVVPLNLDIRRKGGCIPIDAQGHSWLLWTILPLVGVALGLLVFLRAAPANATRLNRTVRALAYSAGMLLFYVDISSYLGLNSLCR
jgi:hypothetical protein